MACAGFLLLENATPVFVEVDMGVLYCRRARPASPSSKEGPGETPSGDATAEEVERGLPALEPRPMGRREASPIDSQRQKMDALFEPESAQPVADEDAGGAGRGAGEVERTLQLSGLVVEVLEDAGELDVPSLPGSFQVVTSKLRVEADGSARSEPRDSLILTARDAASRKLWIKHIKHWNRFGWRDTKAITAERADLEALEAMARHFQQTVGERRTESRGSLTDWSPSRSSAQRHRRRRFYRPTGHAAFVAPP